MTSNEIEWAVWTAARAFRAAGMFADKDAAEALSRAELILNEVRHAATYIDVNREEATARLLELFDAASEA